MRAPCLLPSELTIYTVGELYPQCLQWLEVQEPPSVCVDARAVAEVDAAGVQLLLSLSNALAAEGRRLALVSPSASLVAACEALGAEGLTNAVRLEEVQP